MKSSAKKIKLASVDDLFSTDCSFHFANLICGKVAVDGYFISPRYSNTEKYVGDEKNRFHRLRMREVYSIMNREAAS